MIVCHWFPNILFSILQTYNLHNVGLIVLDSGFSQAYGGLSKFKQAGDTRSGNTYIWTLIVSNGRLQLLPCSTNVGKDVIKEAINLTCFTTMVFQQQRVHKRWITSRGSLTLALAHYRQCLKIQNSRTSSNMQRIYSQFLKKLESVYQKFLNTVWSFATV